MTSFFTPIWYFASFPLFFFLSIPNKFAFGFNNLSVQENIKCIENERLALLSFKQGLMDRHGMLSSWKTRVNNDCCNWRGVQCANDTSHHIIKLDLRGSDDKYLMGEVGSSLTQLSHINYLDLSNNHFDRIVLDDISSLINLNYLNLSYNYFESVINIPPQLGNLSKLSVLDLRESWFEVDSFRWLSSFSSLKHLDLSDVDFHGANDWASAINKLPMLQSLSLSSCNLTEPILPSHSNTNSSRFLVELDLSKHHNLNSSTFYSWLTNLTNLVHLNLRGTNLKGLNLDDFGNMTSLVFLDLTSTRVNFRPLKMFESVCNLNSLHLSGNDMEGLLSDFLKAFPRCVLNSLQYLRLSSNKFSGLLPNLTMLPSLKTLDLSNNMFSGSIPQSLGQLSNLEMLHLSVNKFSGSIPQSLGQLSNLEFLNLGYNLLEGEVSETQFSKLTRLKVMNLSNSPSLNFNFKSDWVPPFQLEGISLRSCNLGPLFPKWLRTQKSVFYIDISSAGISNTVPHWFWNEFLLFPKLIVLSGNRMMGQIPDLSIKFNDQLLIDLESNEFVGRIPSFLFQASGLFLSNNNFSELSGLCEIVSESSLRQLDLSNNQLSGQLPDCWDPFINNLWSLNLSNNYFSGELPHSMSNLIGLKSFILRNNKFSGGLDYLFNLTSLVVIDAINNNLSGTIPSWIGFNLPNLVFLNLKSNHFHGDLPLSVCNINYIQVLDISSNNVSGTIPTCIHNFTAMQNKTQAYTDANLSYANNLVMVYKGHETLISRSLLYLERSIDLSSNHLTGKIPNEITQLVELITLNLSNNELTGQIPHDMGQLQSLEFLDLSRNRLSGPIPTSLSQISRLPVLDLSYNNLSGKIPTGTQLQSFPNSSYEGNPFLCGDPLKKCFEETPTELQPNINTNVLDNENEDWFVLREFFMSMAFGYIVGFWGIFGTLILHRRWRYAYFKFLRDIFH